MQRGVLCLLGLVFAFAFEKPALAEATVTQPLIQVLYNADADYAFFVGANRWGAPSCPNAYYAQVTTGVPGRKQLLAMALIAKQSGAAVMFQGSCGSDPNYFNVTYIVLQ